MGGLDELASVFLPALVFFVVYRLVRGRRETPEEEHQPTPDSGPAKRAGPG